jgi:hypothetical protein
MNNPHAHKATSSIQCEIHKKSIVNMDIVKQQINHEPSVGKKAEYAEALLIMVDDLINCSKYNEQESDCEFCHLYADLNKKTAELIIKAKRLSR